MADYDKEAAAERSKARTKELTEKLEIGMKELFNSDKYKEYLKSVSQFHNYSRRNILLIHLQKPDAKRAASYELWKSKFNRHVKKGEKAIWIYAPTKKEAEKKLMEKLDPKTGEPLLDENGKVIMEEMTTLTPDIRFRLVPVYDVSQTDGDPLPEIIEDLTSNVEHYEAFIETLKYVSPLPIVFEQMESTQDGYCKFDDKIAIREGMSESQTVAAILHEITHAKLHEQRDAAPIGDGGRGTGAEFIPKNRRIKEIEAESIAFVICARFGIETGANSFGYLAEWSRHDPEMKQLKSSLDTIRNEADSLIKDIEKRFQTICKDREIDFSADVEQHSALSEEKAQDQNSEPDETATEQLAQTDIPKKDQPIYKFSAETALQNGESEAFHKSRAINIECGRAIDQAIKENNPEQYRFDLKTAAKAVIDEYGADRTAWVLASTVADEGNDGRFSDSNKSWAKEFDTPKPDFYFDTHRAVLDGFIKRFREDTQPSIMASLEINKQKIKERSGDNSSPGIEKQNNRQEAI